MAKTRAKVPTADLIFGQKEEKPQVKQIKQDASKTEKRQDSKTVRQQNAIEVNLQEGKEKVTLYFLEETIDAIQTAKARLKKEHRIKTSNSAIAEAAILKSIGDIAGLARALKK